MAKNYSYVFVDMASLLLALCKCGTNEEKGRFIQEVVECVITQKRGVNEFADGLMDGVDNFREEARVRKEKSLNKKKEERQAEPPAEIPAQEPEPDQKKDVKRKYGAFGRVMLTDEQLETLKKKYGDRWDHALEVLDSYMESSGKKYKSCFAAFYSWVDKRLEEESINANKGKTFRQIDREDQVNAARAAFPEVMEAFRL